MPELRSRKQEVFARHLADGHTQGDAYELAGYAPSNANASTLANQPHIKQRVEEIKELKILEKIEFEQRLAAIGHKPTEEANQEREEVIEWTVNRLLTELYLNAKLAQTAGAYDSARQSLELIGRALGVFGAEDKGKKNDGKGGTQVSVALIGDALGRLADARGGEASEEANPLAPRVERARRIERDE